MKRYRLLTDSAIEPKAKKGTIVSDFMGCDYGLASDDTSFTGRKHRSVTLEENGGYPSFTHPEAELEEITQ